MGSLTQSLALPVTWMLTQTLSNLVTSNEALMTNLWKLYLSMPEDQMILMSVCVPHESGAFSDRLCSRLLTFPDHKTILVTLVFVMNCIKGSKKRM